MENVPILQRKDCDRINGVVEEFKNRFSKDCSFIARAPGRVNLIGEHVDYSGYGVLPMAIQPDILVAVAPADDGRIRIQNMDSYYKNFEFDANDFEIKKGGGWAYYVLCGWQGILDNLKDKAKSLVNGAFLLIDGRVPCNAGVSSSSALVCGSALSVMHLSGNKMSKTELAELCSKCERYIGTEGGGMDQSICFLAEEGTAKFIEFGPLRSVPVHLPAGAVFVLTHSGVQMNKAATSCFNTRVNECRLAAKVLAVHLGIDIDKVSKLCHVQELANKSCAEMIEIVKEKLHCGSYGSAEISQILAMEEEDLRLHVITEKVRDVTEFYLHDRALHVYSEATRVLTFKNICDQKLEADDNDRLLSLGDLMNESHMSCSQLYDCSCPELDRLTEICKQSGALGSRLTGAGWGGCTVSLVPIAQVERFMETVTREFYGSDVAKNSNMKHLMFSSQPGGGALIYEC